MEPERPAGPLGAPLLAAVSAIDSACWVLRVPSPCSGASFRANCARGAPIVDVEMISRIRQVEWLNTGLRPLRLRDRLHRIEEFVCRCPNIGGVTVDVA